MADDIRIEITGDSSDIKKVLKASEKLVKRFERVNSASTRRRVNEQKRAADKVKRFEERKAKQTAAMERRLSRKRARNRLKLMRERIRIAKREAKAEERIQKKRRANLLRRGKLGAAGAVAALGAAFVFTAKKTMDFDLALTRLAGTQDLTQKKQMELRNAIAEASVATGTGRNALLDTITQIVDKSGDIDLATSNVERLGKIIRVVGEESSSDIGELLAALSVSTAGTSLNAMDAFETIIAQGDKANIVLSDMAQNAKKSIGAFASTGLQGREAFAEYEALLQAVGGILDPSEAVTATKGFFRDIRKKSGKLKEELGIDIYTDETKKNLKPISDIITQIMDKTGGSFENLKKIGEVSEPIQAVFDALNIDLKKNNGELRDFHKLAQMGANASGNIDKKFFRISKTSSQAWKQLGNFAQLLMDETVKGAFDELSKSIQDLLKDKRGMQELRETFQTIGDVLKFLVGAGVKIVSTIRKIGGGLGIAAAKIAMSGEEARNREYMKLNQLQAERAQLATKPMTDALKEKMSKLDVAISVQEGRVKDVVARTNNPNIGVSHSNRWVYGGGLKQ